MDTLATFKASLVWLAPAITLIFGGSLIMCASLVLKTSAKHNSRGQQNALAMLSMLVLVIAGVIGYYRGLPETVGDGVFRFDSVSLAAERLALLGGFLLILISWSTAPRHFLGEFYGSLLIMIGALPLVGASNDLVTLFLGLELVSIPTYILLGVSKTDAPGAEATLKYFMLSAFSSAFFLMGASYLYGVSGSTNIEVIQTAIGATHSKLLTFAVVLVLCGLAFRVTAVPFHFYAPDVFAGTSLVVAAVMSYLPKVVGFVAMIRLVVGPWHPENFATILPVLIFGAAITMIVGNVLAVAQSNLRRLLAYSSVAHTGYLLLGMVALMQTHHADSSVIFSYLAAYAAMTLGLFACLGEIEAAGGRTQLIGDLSGMFYRRPAASIGMTVCLISMIGLPLTGGFWAKFFIFRAATSAGLTNPILIGLVVLMAFNAVIGASYYWRVLSKLYEKSDAHVPLRVFRPSLFVAYTICVVLTLVWFFVPEVM